jgi:hypothetical protein
MVKVDLQELQILKKHIENTTVAREGKMRGQERSPLVVVADRTHYYSACLDQGQRRRPAGGARPISSPTLTAGRGRGEGGKEEGAYRGETGGGVPGCSSSPVMI